MPLTATQFGSLTACTDDANYSASYVVSAGGEWRPRVAAVVARRTNGILVGAPTDDAFELAAGAVAGPFGMSTVLEVESRAAGDPESEAEPPLKVQVVDLIGRAGLALLRMRAPRGAALVPFVSTEDEPQEPTVMPHGPSLFGAAVAWIDGLGAERGPLGELYLPTRGPQQLPS